MNTVAGRAAQLRRDRKYLRSEADELARILFDPSTSCALCGVTNALIAELYARDVPIWGGRQQNRRLTVDRIDPWQDHTIANTRIACFQCNNRRGRGTTSDLTVALATRSWWRENAPADLLGWLETPVPARHVPADLVAAF